MWYGFHSETYIDISPYLTLWCGFHCETYISISPYRTLCCGFQYETYISTSPYRTLCCGFQYETYISISPYRTLCCGFQYETYISTSPYRTLCCGFHHKTYISISPYRTLCCDFQYETYISISPYRTLCCGFQYETYISTSPYRTLCCGFHYETYISISPYRTLCCDFQYETYISISPYRTLFCGFHYETYISISPYRTLVVHWAQCMVVMQSGEKGQCERVIFQAAKQVSLFGISTLGQHHPSIGSMCRVCWDKQQSMPAWIIGDRGFEPHPGLQFQRNNIFFNAHSYIFNNVGSLRDRGVACSPSDHQGPNFESCVWRTVSYYSCHHPQELILAQFSLYVHKSGLKSHSFHLNADRSSRYYSITNVNKVNVYCFLE